VDEVEIRKAAPTLVITQDLCQVCAPSGNEATQVLKSMSPKPEILWQTPHSFEDVLKDILALGEKTGTVERAEKLVEEMRRRVAKVSSAIAKLQPVKVFFLEWVDPVYCGGHWVPQMLQWAGGVDGISRSGVDSVRIAWEEVVRFNPEVLIVSPCGFSTKDALKQADLLKSRPGWKDIKAVQNDRVFAVDANAYFAKPGPRLADGVELLAHLIHPELFSWQDPTGAFAKVEAGS
jgi:iron complex transport system substrate-binding protein